MSIGSPDISATQDGTVEVHGSALRTNELGLVQLLFQSLASAAPGISITITVIIGADFAGAALNLSMILALIGILLIATCVGQMAKEFPTAGGFYTYISRGLHPSLGTLVAWLYLIVWFVFPSTLFLAFGHFVASTAHSDFGWSITPVWITSALACIAFVYLFVFNGARLSAELSIALGTFELLVLAALAVWFVVDAGSRNTISVFGTVHANVTGYAGASGIVGATVFAIWGFIGFENVVPLAEEANRPRQGVMRAALLSPLIVGVFMIFCTYASTVFFGVERYASFTSFNHGNPWFGITEEVWGGGWYVLLFVVLNSCVASANSATNAATRHAYSMSRIKLLAEPFARVSERHGTPVTALIALTAISVGVTLGAGLGTGSPLEGFAFLGTIVTGVVILLYMLVAAACLVWFVRHRPPHFNLIIHAFLPVLGIGVMVPTLMAAIGVGSSIFSFVTPLAYPLDVAGYIALGWLIAGVIYAAYHWRRHPDRVYATERVFIEDRL